MPPFCGAFFWYLPARCIIPVRMGNCRSFYLLGRRGWGAHGGLCTAQTARRRELCRRKRIIWGYHRITIDNMTKRADASGGEPGQGVDGYERGGVSRSFSECCGLIWGKRSCALAAILRQNVIHSPTTEPPPSSSPAFTTPASLHNQTRPPRSYKPGAPALTRYHYSPASVHHSPSATSQPPLPLGTSRKTPYERIFHRPQ